MRTKKPDILNYVTILTGSRFCAVVLMARRAGDQKYRIKWTTGNLILRPKAEVLALAESWAKDCQTTLQVQTRMRWPQ